MTPVKPEQVRYLREGKPVRLGVAILEVQARKPVVVMAVRHGTPFNVTVALEPGINLAGRMAVLHAGGYGPMSAAQADALAAVYAAAADLLRSCDE
jgi:hypothetical protein